MVRIETCIAERGKMSVWKVVFPIPRALIHYLTTRAHNTPLAWLDTRGVHSLLGSPVSTDDLLF